MRMSKSKDPQNTGSNTKEMTSLERGAAVIRAFAKSLPDTPGVYRMLDDKGEPLYVGKAKALKRRVVSYANTDQLSLRIKRMVAQTKDMIVIHTHTEVEALLLEANLIKKLQPYYNILLKDDKSFPYIFLSGDHDFPMIGKHRGPQKRRGHYYGPYTNLAAVNRSLTLMQKVFMIRNCTDSYFEQRKRPCLQYHIKRCTAPCVGYVSEQDYKEQARMAHDFLSGKNQKVQKELAVRMQKASEAMDYEEAALLRDRIRTLTVIQSKQDINVAAAKNADVIGLYRSASQSCVQVFFFRSGYNIGNRAYILRHDESLCDGEIMANFIVQFYENKPIPPQILLSEEPLELDLIAQSMNARADTEKQDRISVPRRGDKRRVIDFVLRNAKDYFEREQAKESGIRKNLENIATLFGLDAPPKRIEIYDNSHISGTNMVGGMVVAGPEGPRKNAYRKFNIRHAEAADDYGMMREVIERRFGRSLREDKGPGSDDWPDLVLIDGGAGQLSAVLETLQALGIEDDVKVVAIAKGPDRDAGREKFFMRGRDMFQLPERDATLHYLQRLRDEAHRYAIGVHRAKRTKQIESSPLDNVPGIGAKRKKALLHHFGSARSVAQAGIRDLQNVDGISQSMAENIYAYFNDV
jgi:excinuclease ABC subunit C